LILAVAGILFLTMYPFRFSFHAPPGGASPFLLGHTFKSAGLRDAFLNILLFVPFGFGLAEKLRERGRSARFVLLTVYLSGVLFSYTIEFLQLYIPDRDSGWEDVVTNSSGAALGAFLYVSVGRGIVQLLNSIQESLAALLLPRRLAVALIVYFGVWFLAAALMQRQTRLTDWDAQAMLVIGNDGTGQYPWRGQIKSLQLWNRPVTPDSLSREAEKVEPKAAAVAPIASFDFSNGFTPDTSIDPTLKLFWVPATLPAPGLSGDLTLDGKSWLSSKAPATRLIETLQATNQFSIRLVCTPGELNDSSGRIVSISDSNWTANLTLRQEGTSLIFWFRTPLSARHAQLGWSVPAIFTNRLQREILYSYDGSNLYLWVDGEQRRDAYQLGPGTVLARTIRWVRRAEVKGYNLIFYAIVFCPAGMIFGLFFAGKGGKVTTSRLVISLVTLCFAAAALEVLLDSVSGRPASILNIGVAFAAGAAALLWSFADRPLQEPNSREGLG
jgi:hypothetical protein